MDHVLCSCGRRYSLAQFLTLPLCGYQDDGEGGRLELRNCVCGSTHSRPGVERAGDDALEDTLPGVRLAPLAKTRGASAPPPQPCMTFGVYRLGVAS